MPAYVQRRNVTAGGGFSSTAINTNWYNGRILRAVRMSNHNDYSLKYAPLLRLLEAREQDLEYLQEQKGYSPDLGREYDSLRKSAIHGYLRALEKDWKLVYRQAVPYAVNDPQMAEMLATLDHQVKKALRRIRLQMRFEGWYACRRIRGVSTAALLEQMSEIARLSLPSAAM